MSVGVALCPRTTVPLLGGIEKRIAANAAVTASNAATDATRKVAGVNILFLINSSYLAYLKYIRTQIFCATVPLRNNAETAMITFT